MYSSSAPCMHLFLRSGSQRRSCLQWCFHWRSRCCCTSQVRRWAPWLSWAWLGPDLHPDYSGPIQTPDKCGPPPYLFPVWEEAPMTQICSGSSGPAAGQKVRGRCGDIGEKIRKTMFLYGKRIKCNILFSCPSPAFINPRKLLQIMLCSKVSALRWMTLPCCVLFSLYYFANIEVI